MPPAAIAPTVDEEYAAGVGAVAAGVGAAAVVAQASRGVRVGFVAQASRGVGSR